MSKKLLAITVGLLASGGAVCSSFGADTGNVSLHGHVPAAVSRSQATGSLASETALDLAIGLPLRNREALTNLLQQIYDPGSPLYHHYLTADQFADIFGPTKEEYEAVADFARRNGLKVTATHPNRMVLDVSGNAGDIQKAFHVHLKTYHHPTENRDFFAPDTEPTVPGGLPLQDVSGLDNYRRPHSHYKIKPSSVSKTADSKTSSANAATGSGPGGNYVGDDFRNAYVPGTTLNGSGQAVALVQFDGYLASDIIAYENLAGRTNIPLQNVLIDGFSGVPTGFGGEVEVSLDIEMCLSMAPALSKIILYEGNPFNFHPNDVLNRIVTDNAAKQVSCSWGWSGGPSATTDQIFQQMALQGQTFFDAVGDSDAFPTGAVDDPNQPNEPSSTPYITQVGGTTLTMNSNGAAYASEVVWNWGTRFGDDGVGSSGGISSFYSIPSWQTNINMAIPQGSATKRNVPDVALTADDVLVIADGGARYFGVGGTSVAAPLWAGFTALVNQRGAQTSHAPVGFINPALYAIAASSTYTNCFNDIVVGNNEWSGSPNLFVATNGYDLCTGLGTPKGTNLISALLANAVVVTHISPPFPPYGTNLAALNGSNPNGTWSLFVQDDTSVNSGVIANGWVLNLTTANSIGSAADVELLMTTTNSSAIYQGHSITYFLTVTNYGPSGSTNVIVSDSLPSGITILSTNITTGTLTRSGSTLIWNLGTLATNVGGALTLTIQPQTTGSYINYALVSSSTADPNPDDDSKTIVTDVVSLQGPQLSGLFVKTNGSFSLTVPAPTNPPTTVIVQASTNLANWANVYTSTPPFTYKDANATNYPMRFYRVMLVP